MTGPRMYRIYWERLSGAVLPQVMLAELGLPSEWIHVDMEKEAHRSPWYLAVNPSGQVPALALPEGAIIGESAAMVLVLGERHAAGGLVPRPEDPQRPAFLRWLLFMAASVYMTFVRVNHPERFTTNPADIESVREAAIAAVDDQFATLAAALMGDPWFLPGGYSALDIYAAMLADWHPDRARLFTRHPALERLCVAVAKRQAYREVMNHHRP